MNNKLNFLNINKNLVHITYCMRITCIIKCVLHCAFWYYISIVKPFYNKINQYVLTKIEISLSYYKLSLLLKSKLYLNAQTTVFYFTINGTNYSVLYYKLDTIIRYNSNRYSTNLQWANLLFRITQGYILTIRCLITMNLYKLNRSVVWALLG